MGRTARGTDMAALHRLMVDCVRCPRLVAWRERVGREKRRAFAGEEYWSRPVPGFGDPDARLVVFGLAPGAHGSNRTGRPFTGDGSGVFLYRALHRAGLASRPTAVSRDDGLVLTGVFITAAVRCVPPANKPDPGEIANCADWTERELSLLPSARGFLALGRIGHDALLAHFGLRRASRPFAHGALHELPGGLFLLDSYHVSQQNTQTGKLTETMFDTVLGRARELSGL